jgi:UDP-2,3-diacylglucosamine hydrolase
MKAGLTELVAPAHWRTLDFISDLHLEASAPQTRAIWADYLAQTPADALFILGDLFEVWVGDDQLGEEPAGFAALCAQSLAQAGEKLALFLMHGNRDFLMGATLMQRCQATLLADPCKLSAAGQHWLLSHGDALCLDDKPYMDFRRQVRSEVWQAQFLARPLPERQAIARQIRQQSQQQLALRSARGEGYAEVDTQAALSSLQQAGATTLIHGHTHRPARHELAPGYVREVLSDWDAQAQPVRAQVLRLSLTAQGQAAGLQRIDLH